VKNRAFIGRFLDEARVVVRLKHPNIARVYAMGENAGEYFLTMEYVQGKTVSRFTKRLRDRKAQMPLGIILLIGERICEGLQYAHRALDEKGNSLHLVHRDLSPANVCISYRGEVKIIDFGAAQSTLKEEQTAPRVVIGNLTYMAPEQAKKLTVDGRADVYSAGVLLWELLAWHALPQKGDPIQRWRKAANPNWEAPSLYHGNIPSAVDRVILKALDKDPDRRFGSATEFGEALKALRLTYARQTGEGDIGALLAEVFKREKAGEDALLQSALEGRPEARTQNGRSRRLQLVPPTALAFEHTAVLAPPHFVPVTLLEAAASGLGKPWRDAETTVDEDSPLLSKQRASKKDINSTRTSFGVHFYALNEPRIEPSIIQEIEGEFDREGEDDLTRPYDSLGKRRLLFAAVFSGAAASGFLLVWLMLTLSR
jgi:eukaryotic-like serine/threonine-protein kinase